MSEFTATLWYFLLITHDCVFPQDGCTSGSNPREGNVNVIVQVIDTDDEPPVFSQDNYDVTIPERNSSFVYTGLSASDGDLLNASLRYSFIGEYIPSHQHNWTLTQKDKNQQQQHFTINCHYLVMLVHLGSLHTTRSLWLLYYLRYIEPVKANSLSTINHHHFIVHY